MQTARTHIAVSAAPRAASRRTASVVCQAVPEQPATTRRSIAAAIFAAPIIASALPAAALILDDEDLELLEKTKAARKSKIAQEKATEPTVQTAVNNLSKTGALLEAGKPKEVPALVGAGSAWVQDLKRTTTEVGGTDETKAFASQIFAGLAKLEKSAGQGNLKGAKADYVEAVEALETWAVLAGFSSSVQGL